MEYIVHVKGIGSKIVDNKRFTAESLNELADKVNSYFRFDFELIRLEKVSILENYGNIKFGTNFNVIA